MPSTTAATTTARGAGLRLAALAALAAAVAGACGSITERKERADRIIDSVDRAAEARSALMTVAVRNEIKLGAAGRAAQATQPAPPAQPDPAPAPAAQAAQPPPAQAGPGVPQLTVTAEADLRRGRVAYIAPGPDGGAQVMRIYSGTTIYARRAAQAAAAGQSRRPWVRLDLTSLDPDEIDNDTVETPEAVRRIQQTSGFDNPLFLLKLLRGALSGSVEQVGREEVRGVPTTRYELNIDRDKAVRDDDEDVQDAYEAMFKSLFATGTVFPAEVWLDDEGLPRRYVLTLKSKVRRRAIADIHLTVELFDVGRPVRIVLPGRGDTAVVDGLGSLARAVGWRDA